MKKRHRPLAAGPNAPAAKSARTAEGAAGAFRRKRRLLMAALAAAALLAACGSYFQLWSPNASADALLEQARRALADEKYADAEELCMEIISRDGPQLPAILTAGEAAQKQGRLFEALGYYSQLPSESHDQRAAIGYAAAGDILLQMHRASAAETQFRRALDVDSQLLVAHQRLAYLLGIEGRRWESLPHHFAALRAGKFSLDDLLLLGDHAAAVGQAEELDKFLQATPDDRMPLLGKARLALLRDQPDLAQRWLSQVLAQAPHQIEARAELGRLLLARRDAELSRWLRDVAPEDERHPDTWMTRGLWAKELGETRGAARSFWEAIKLDPSHQAAVYQLAQALEALGDSPSARRLSERAARLEKLAGAIKLLNQDRRNLALLRSAAELTEALGCAWEAQAWHRVILSIDPQSRTSLEALRRLQSALTAGPPLVLDSENPAVQIDLSNFPLPAWNAAPSDSKSQTPSLANCRVHFADASAQAGIEFRYFAGQDENADRSRMYQFTGGGAAVLDYDADGWPDVYLTQGCRWPPVAGQTDHYDRLFRNRGDGTFEDVTERSRLAEDRFSQGAAAGDINNDGFTDLYVANIGVNRLYVNQGDGTFRDMTEEAGIDDAAWTTSCLLADLNGDGLADLYDVNYLQGADVFERVCNEGGKPRTCPPTVFEAQPDRFYLNLGNGRFEDRTESAGFAVAGGNGLGVVAGDFDGSGRLSLFVANDQDANFLFVNETSGAAAPRFVERGVLSGLAYDADGKAQACMGVAAADANDDGRLDLFVTNFYEESNALYLQQAAGMFDEAASASGLRAPSFRMLGFGAQFIDGELDGIADLVVTNGHIDDFTHRQVPWHMPSQYFRGLGGGKFEELPAAELGEFFERKRLGRGLARLDFNRDGREDFVVSHLDSPAALVANDTKGAGHFLAVQLRGVQSARDAIGAEVTVSTSGARRTQWMTAGDGYLASNERQLIFGLGRAERVEKLVIRWPSGLRQEFADLAADQALIAIEGAARLRRLDLFHD